MEQALEADGEALPAGSGDVRRAIGWPCRAPREAGAAAASSRRPARRPAARPSRSIRRSREHEPAPPDRDAGLDAPLREVVSQYDDVQAELATPEVTRDPDALRRLGRSSPGSSPSSRRSGRSRRRGPSSPAPARCATAATPTPRCGRWRRRDRPADGRRGAPARGAEGAPPAARPERRPRRDPRDPGRRRRRRGGPVRRRALPDVRPLRRAPPVHARSCSASTRPGSAGSRRRSSRSTATARTAG